MRAWTALLTPAALAGLLLAGCGQELLPSDRTFKSMQTLFKNAVGNEREHVWDQALERYQKVCAIADSELLPRLAPGDEILPEVRKMRDESAAGIARVKEAQRREKAGGGGQEAPVSKKGAPLTNLPPPVLAYRPPEVKPPDGEDGPKDPKDPKDTPDPKDPKDTPDPKDPPPPPAEPKTVRVDKVVLKADGKTVLIYWTYTNLSDNKVLFGAPMGELLNATGGVLTKFRQHFLQAGFELNSEDPLASKGTAVNPEAFAVGGREVRKLVTVGTTTQGKQAGGARVVMRTGEAEVQDSLQSIIKE